MAFNYEELTGSPKESGSESGGPSVERYFLGPWDQRLAFVDSVVSTGYPNMANLRLVDWSAVPYDAQNRQPFDPVDNPAIQSAGYGEQPCLITLIYGPDFTTKTWPNGFTKPTDILTGTELRLRMSSSAEFLVLPEGAAKPDGSNNDLRRDENGLILIPYKDIELQWDFVPAANLRPNDFDTYMGKTNGNTFLGAEPETMLFENYNIEDSFSCSPTNPHLFRLNAFIRQRRIKPTDTNAVYGWNHEYIASANQWQRVKMSVATTEEANAPIEDIDRYPLSFSFNAMFNGVAI